MTKSSVAKEQIIVGVDTHKDVHVAVAIDSHGRLLGQCQVATTQRGCRTLHEWALGLAPQVRCGVEGTDSYGAGLARFLAAEGASVTEIRGPNRKLRRDRGKSDTIDAEAAARAVLAGTSRVVPKAGNDWVEQLRMLRLARRSAVQARTQAINQMHAVVVGAPPELHDALVQLSRVELIRCARRFRIGRLDTTASTTRWTLRLLALRHEALTAEINAIDQEILPLLANRREGRVRSKPDPEALTVFDWSSLFQDDAITYAGERLELKDVPAFSVYPVSPAEKASIPTTVWDVTQVTRRWPPAHKAQYPVCRLA